MNIDWSSVLGLIGGALGGGSVVYLWLDKKVRSNGEKAEDRKKGNEADKEGLEFHQALDEWQTDKLKEILNDYDSLKENLREKVEENLALNNKVFELSLTIEAQNKELAELRSRTITLEEENKVLREKNISLQEEVIKKNEEIIQARKEVIEARTEESSVVGMACAEVPNGCKLFNPLFNQNDGNKES